MDLVPSILFGQFDGEQFINDNTPDAVLWLDYGRDFTPPRPNSDIPAADGRRIGISWMSNWLYANQCRRKAGAQR